jgi:anion-transporting  ArsA/GET3 family ATPase
LISDSEIYFNRTKSQLSRKITQNENDLSIINSNINATYESLKNLDKIQGMNQETIELSHSRTLDNLQMLTEQRTTLINNILDIRNELENMENSKIVVVTSDGQKEESSSNKRLLLLV